MGSADTNWPSAVRLTTTGLELGRLRMAFHHVDALNNSFSISRIYAENFALFALVFTGQDDNVIAFFNLSSHIRVPPVQGRQSSCSYENVVHA